MIDQTKTFEKFIESLINQTGDEASFREAVLTIYGEGWRHSYSFVTRYILRNNKTSDDLAETLESLSEQIAELIPLFTEEKAKADNDDTTEVLQQKYRRCHRALEKLKDHVDLEAIRMNHLYQQALDPLVTQTKEIKQGIDKAKNDLNHQRTESITILGIFASIIVTFVAGFSLSNSLLSNINSLSLGTMGFWCVVLMGFIVNVLYSLYNMLYTLNGKPKIIWYKNWFNILLTVLAAFFIFIASSNKEIDLPFFSNQQAQAVTK